MTTKHREYPSLWIASLSIEKLDGVDGVMSDIVATKAYDLATAANNIRANYKHARLTPKTIIRVSQIFQFSELISERMCHDLNAMPEIDFGSMKLTKEVAAIVNNPELMTADKAKAALEKTYAESPKAPVEARPMGRERQARSIGQALKHEDKQPEAETPRRRAPPARRVAATPAPAPATATAPAPARRRR